MKKPVDADDVADGLKRLGVKKGDVIMVHSSLSAFGYVEDGAETIIDGLLKVIGSDGTIVMPGFRDDVWNGKVTFKDYCGSCSGFKLCPNDEPGLTGAIPEALRKKPGTLKSCHPTHSWIAFGKDAKLLLEAHRYSPTPCGLDSPFEGVLRSNGHIILLGVCVNSVTVFHWPEDVMSIPALGSYIEEIRHITYTPRGFRIQYTFPNLIYEVLKATGLIFATRIGLAQVFRLPARGFANFVIGALSDNPWALVCRPTVSGAGFLPDALEKAKRMLQLWYEGIQCKDLWPELIGTGPKRYILLDDARRTIHRRDCPSFKEICKEHPKIGFCEANNRDPFLIHRGGMFNRYGIAQCNLCPWHLSNKK